MSNTFAKYKKLDKKNFDALSIPGYVIKKNLTEARQPKYGGCKTVVERWHNDDKYREPLSDIGWTEEQITQYDEVALEVHSCIATRGGKEIVMREAGYSS